MFKDIFQDKHCIFMVGCGGGYDIFSGLPLYFHLRDQGKKVILGNFSFTDPKKYRGSAAEICKGAYRIQPDFEELSILDEICMTTREFRYFLNQLEMTEDEYIASFSKNDYFPELRLSSHPDVRADVILLEINDSVPRSRKLYEELHRELQFDTVVLVDGGTDSIMFGHEEELGTPYEDMMHICAVWSWLNSCPQLSPPVASYLLMLGYGLEQGIKCEDIECNISTLDSQGGFLGTYPLSLKQTETQRYRDVVTSSNPRHSIICAGVAAALDGEYGPLHGHDVEDRVCDARPIVQERTSQYYLFDLFCVARNVRYMNHLINAEDLEIMRAIDGDV